MTKVFGGFLLFLFAAGAEGAPIVYDLAADWSDTINSNEVWSYRSSTTILPSVANWTPGLYPYTQPAWAPGTAGGSFLPAWFKSAGDPGPGHDWELGDVVVHSHDFANGLSATPSANVLWISPVDGTIDISGAVWMGREIGRSNDWQLFVNGALISSGSISSGDPFDRLNPFLFSMGLGGPSALLNVPVSIGDTVQLDIVRTSLFGDFVGANLTITATEAPPTAIPEPSTGWALGTSILIVFLVRRWHCSTS